MRDFAVRYSRQILLAEVGQDGQARICASAAPVAGGGLEHRAAELYARRAGFAALEKGPIDVEELAPRGIVEHAAARLLLAGARAALAAFRAAAFRPGAHDER